MNKIRNNIIALLWILTIPLSNVIYQLLNNNGRGANSLVTDFDRSTPFVAAFAVPYLLWFLFIGVTLAYLCFKDRSTYYKTLIAVNISLIACYVIYYFYQTTVPRPQLAGNDIFTKLVGFIYSSDQPFNCFPSIHCLTSYMMMKAIYSSSVRNAINTLVVYGSGILVILSTLFIKQHVVLDAISAILLGGAVFDLVSKFYGERMPKWVKKQFSLLTMRRKLET